ncbi:MAG: Oligosaccharyltransferase subunit Ribophorin II-domain-containing protein [Monoraphidium minutum]|nr:MAG: Oligosaccharyltransferase subunit Ribophorin II-domain-containing protein [Monoraphidium minutum]
METEPVKEAAKPAKKAKAPKATVLSVDDAEADVVSASGKKLAHKAAKFGATLLDRVSLDVGASLEVVFTPKTDGEASKPQQAMLMAVPASNPALAAYAVAKARKDGSHAATLSQAAVEKQLGPVGGKYAVTLLLGDPAAPKGVRWELGSATLAMSSEGGAASPAYKSALVQPMTNVLPNIAHIFRSPEKRPPAVVSLAFAGLAFAPLALLVLYLAATGGLALPNFPAGGGGLWALLFHGGIAALLGLYWLFWTRLNLAQTLPAALGVGAFTAAAGYKALSALADARLSQERAGATVAKKTN